MWLTHRMIVIVVGLPTINHIHHLTVTNQLVPRSTVGKSILNRALALTTGEHFPMLAGRSEWVGIIGDGEGVGEGGVIINEGGIHYITYITRPYPIQIER